MADSIFFLLKEQLRHSAHILLGTYVVEKASYAFSNYLVKNRREMRMRNADVGIAVLGYP